MKKSTFLQAQAIEFRRVLETVQDDPVLAPQLKDRIQALEREIRDLPPSGTQIELPRTAVFFRGGGVSDSDGIRPSLAGEALIQYEKMYIEQSLFDEREAAKDAGRSRRPNGSSAPELLFTGTPRGSFGLEFVPVIANDPLLQESRSRSLDNVTSALAKIVGAAEDTIEAAIEEVPPAVLSPMKNFIKVVSKYGAELRLAYSKKKSIVFSTEMVRKALEQMEREVSEEEIIVNGVFRGLTLQSGFFDLMTDSGELITGIISDEMPEADRLVVLKKTNETCTLIIRRTIVKAVSKQPRISHVLLRAK